jgi:excinuclease UvrABC ATPase subunit
VIAKGTPEAIAKVKSSPTGQYLARALRGQSLAVR